MNPYVKQVKALPDYRLELTFENGEVKIFDATPFLERGDFIRLKDPVLFKTVRMVAGSIEWLGGLDFSYDTMYLLGRPANKPSNTLENPETRKVAEPPKPYGKD